MSNVEERPYVPAKKVHSDYPLIDSDPYIGRVLSYTRPSDYVVGATVAASGPALLYTWEKFAPSYVGKGGFAPVMRLTGFIGLTAGFLTMYQRSILRFYGFSENSREVDMDMKEMVAKVKKGEPLYGVSSLSPYMQGVASRNSRYSGVFLHIMPWFNFVHHNQMDWRILQVEETMKPGDEIRRMAANAQQHGVDTAKYYAQAERELAAEAASKN